MGTQHREAIETLFPMPTHRDKACWWAGQHSQMVETALLFRGHYLFYPGSLRVLEVSGLGLRSGGRLVLRSRRSKYEKHAKYPRRACFDNATEPDQPGEFSKIFADLKSLVTRSAWVNSSTRCLDALVTRCRSHGEIDLPSTAKEHRSYFWRSDLTSAGSLAQQQVFQPPCSSREDP